MRDNPVVAAVRKARKRISARYGNDLRKLLAHYQGLERRYTKGGIYCRQLKRKVV